MMKSIEFLRVLVTLHPHFATNALQCIDEIQEMATKLLRSESDRTVVESRLAARDVEWCKMLGYSEAGAVGNTPEFMQRELDAMEDVDAADHVRCRTRLAAAEEALWAYADWARQGHDSNWLPQGHKDAIDAAKRRKEGKAELEKVKMSI
jgi:hypothetical protein